MKIKMNHTLVFMLLSCLFLINCRSQVKDEKANQVERNKPIEAAADPADPLLQYQTPPVISKEKKEALTLKSDSI